MNKKEFVLVTETGGFMSAITGMRYPTKSRGDSMIVNGNFVLGEKDAKLAKTLLNKKEVSDGKEIHQGDVHGKFQRAIVAWMNINMPLFMWAEIDTYCIGTLPVSSESTMYTLKKELKSIVGPDGTIDIDSFYKAFSDDTDIDMVRKYYDIVMKNVDKYGDISDVPIHKLKADLPSGWLQARVRAFTYQTLRRLYILRKNHRLPQWQHFIKAIESLPYFDELIMGR